MIKKQSNPPRKPATKFAHLRKKMQQRKIEARLVRKASKRPQHSVTGEFMKTFEKVVPLRSIGICELSQFMLK